ncbi:YitT family protein [Niallia sp. XMNu-256]|uniref:YczE/YyaS/YitT family protein n=1 Tax=Niallia sp. XMNu-256 TaxID=3082444 RepID=UPI0030D3B8CE
MRKKYKGQLVPRFMIFLLGLLVMTFGVVLIIIANIGPSSWDVLHIGLYYRFGLTIGTWSILVGVAIVILSAILLKSFPPIGTFLNMLLVGIFIDMFLLLPFLQTPESYIGKIVMFLCGLIINGYGMGLYISAQLGAGPRDSLMLAITSITNWKVGPVRTTLEIVAVLIGWQLGGPLFWGTIVYSVLIGVTASFTLPQCQKLTDFILSKWHSHKQSQQIIEEYNRGV